jgi:hypothetical protein
MPLEGGKPLAGRRQAREGVSVPRCLSDGLVTIASYAVGMRAQMPAQMGEYKVIPDGQHTSASFPLSLSLSLFLFRSVPGHSNSPFPSEKSQLKEKVVVHRCLLVYLIS